MTIERVCLSVCLSVCPSVYLKYRISELLTKSCVLVACGRGSVLHQRSHLSLSSSDGTAMRYVRPVLCMTSCFPITCPMATMLLHQHRCSLVHRLRPLLRGTDSSCPLRWPLRADKVRGGVPGAKYAPLPCMQVISAGCSGCCWAEAFCRWWRSST